MEGEEKMEREKCKRNCGIVARTVLFSNKEMYICREVNLI